MTAIILTAVILIVAMGSFLDQLGEQGYMTVQDVDAIVDQTLMVADIMSSSEHDQREWLLEKVKLTGLDVSLTDLETLQRQVASSPPRHVFDTFLTWLFPPEDDLPAGGKWVVLDGRLALALAVDPTSVLVLQNIPQTVESSEFVTPFTYYVLSFITLVLLFSAYAVRAMTRPLSRIVQELDRTDGVAQENPVPEQGTVEVIKLAKALNSMRERIRSLVEMRMRMLRSVSHDLRTPLTRMRLRSEQIDNPSLRHSMLTDIERIDSLISETLDYLRLDAQGEQEEPVDLSSLLQTVKADFADVGFDIRYKGPDRLACVCRPNSLARAVTNLCDNAVKFGQSVDITLERVGDGIRIDVSDDGPGIAADQRALVLEPFYRTDAARSQDLKSGFGLGLSIVSDIIRAHGGTVEFHDRKPHGLVVRLVLPCPPPDRKEYATTR